MKYLVWVFKSFGFKAGVSYCWDMTWLNIRRFLGLSAPPRTQGSLSWSEFVQEEERSRDLNGTNNRTLH